MEKSPSREAEPINSNSPKEIFPFRFSDENYVCISYLRVRTTRSTNLICLHFITSILFDGKCNLPFQFAAYSNPLLLTTLLSLKLQAFSLPTSSQKAHPLNSLTASLLDMPNCCIMHRRAVLSYCLHRRVACRLSCAHCRMSAGEGNITRPWY
jgi:hypothetical protein